ncbi:MAG: adenylate/guanylate cyclase domain-containing protein [Oscillospiraceae bacterium]|nr:adenylate/guanylate cyclase domain-containing protein [Oscillospiraceae bacterium]
MKEKLVKYIAAIAAAGIFTAAAGLGLLDAADYTAADRLYQSPSATDGEIVVVGMDQHALDVLGPLPWSRSVYARLVSVLNADGDKAPAAIGIDVLFAGEGADGKADEELIQACAEGGNVVAASAASFGSRLVTEGEDFYMDTSAVLAWDGPFDELARVVDTGHINTMEDSDGIIRHALFAVDVPGRGRVRSFARVIYERWCAHEGIEPSEEPPLSRDGFFYLPFTTGPGGYYDGVSAAELLEGEVPPDYFAGKIVLIGPYAAGMQDEYTTSVNRAGHMYGIEIQANQIEAYRTGFFPREMKKTPQLILLFCIGVLMYLFFRERKLIWALAGWLAVSAGWVGLCLVLYKAGVIMRVVWTPLLVTLLFILTVAAHYFRAQKEKRRVTATFGRYVDPAILKELLAQGGGAGDLGGKSFDIAVLFVDIRGFTSMSETLPPATVVQILNRYLSLTTQCIMRYHGTLDKFVGDCTMAFWNAPLPQEDPVYLACCAAMDMVEGSRELGEELQRQFGRTVDFGVGVHFGPAVVGNIGAPQRMDYTAIGDTVNTASRLESNAPGGTVFISRAVADILGDRATVSAPDHAIRLKGKTEGFEVLVLNSLRRDKGDQGI